MRPEPDEAPLDDVAPPQPERGEPRRDDPDVSNLTAHDWLAISKRAVKAMMDDNMMMIASALAYATFFAIPSVLLVVVGLFTWLAGPQTITTVISHLGHVMPAQATQLLESSVRRLDQRPSASIAMTIVGLVLALWSTTSAMTSYMTAVNLAYGRKDRRNFFKKRLIALTMAACIGVAFILVAVFLLFGPTIEKHLGQALGAQSLLPYLWWVLQWPILLAGLSAAFATLLWLGPNLEQPKWRLLTPGTAIAVVIWLLASAAFAVYTAKFSTYNKTWGSISAVIVMLTWLWLTALALLFGAEFNAETERSRELRQGQPAKAKYELQPVHDRQL